MSRDIKRVTGLVELAEELVDEILAHVGHHRDLMAFALTSRFSARIAIPRHTEYRVLYITTPRPDMWRHLSCCSTFTSNIREVHLGYAGEDTQRIAEKFPVSLVDPVLDDSSGASEEELKGDIRRAFVAMRKITTFTWKNRGKRFIPLDQTAGLVENLAKLQTLECLSLVYSSQKDFNSILNQTWNLSNLTHLRLRGAPSQAEKLTKWLQTSPSLVFLRIWTRTLSLAVEASDLAFPMLTTLSLHGTSQEPVIRFIQRHLTIEEFRWSPPDVPDPLPPGFLPNCKRFHVSTCLLDALEANYLATVQASSLEASSTQNLRRRVEVIQVLDTLFPNLLPYQFLDPISLFALYMSTQDLEILHNCATRFPMIRWLEISSESDSPKWTIDEWILALSRFAHLDTIGGPSIRDLVHDGEISEQELIRRLALSCPNLRYLNNFGEEGERLTMHRLPCGGEFATDKGDDAISYTIEKRTTR
ncbi:hypothetical protein BDN72DRAFT_899995 [Pluteus cervinus]|uniref:Uncharacterized protein n=1 Tax=Pluteus cervinus TaxID=181527 RepID=A0ACD3AL62_9AGAR|nr:hypothetical protein BDN72DRAFT_899995 [Pluteus cervinus]